MDWKGLVPMARKLLEKNASTILLVSGTLGMAATVGMSVKAAPKVKEVISEAKDRKDEGEEAKDVAIRVCKNAAPYILPPAIVGGATLASFYGAVYSKGRANAALAAAASVSERALMAYQEKVIDKFGEEEHGAILEGIADDILKDDVADPTSCDLSSVEGSGDTLCYDRVTGRYFRSTVDAIRKAENVVVKRVVEEMVVPLNDFYEELGLEDVSVIGEAIGWDVAKVKPDIRFSSRLDPDGSVPVLVLNYHTCLIRRSALEGMY